MEHTLRYQSRSLPSFENATIGDVMHVGVIGVPPEADIETVARAFASNRIHCLVVDGVISEDGRGERLVWGTITHLDLLRAGGARGAGLTAARLAATEAVTAYPSDSLECAAQLMNEHDVSHLVITSLESGRPIGVVSALDLAATLAWGE